VLDVSRSVCARKALPIGGLLILVGLACALPALGATKNVTLQNIAYHPPTVTIHVGDMVTWTHADGGTPHSVTADAGQADSFDSNPTNCPPVCMVSGDTFSHVFKKAGTFTYHCRIHGDPNCGMCGKVVVTAEMTPAPTPVQTQTPAATQAPTQRTAPPGAFAPVPLSATPLPLPSLTPAPLVSSGETVRPFGTPLAAPKSKPVAKRGPLVGLAIAAVMVSTGAAVATWLRYGRPS
jgi:plastocyanin